MPIPVSDWILICLRTRSPSHRVLLCAAIVLQIRRPELDKPFAPSCCILRHTRLIWPTKTLEHMRPCPEVPIEPLCFIFGNALCRARSDSLASSTLRRHSVCSVRNQLFVHRFDRRSFCASSRTIFSNQPRHPAGGRTHQPQRQNQRSSAGSSSADGAEAFCQSSTVRGPQARSAGGSSPLVEARRAGGDQPVIPSR